MKTFNLILFATILCLAAGCREAADSHGHSHDGDDAHSHGTAHSPPHGGTPVLVADDEFHLELVLDATSAKMQAYVLDGHLESYIPVTETNFVLTATSDDGENQLTFHRVRDSTSGKADDKSSLFEAQADWLKSAKSFDGNIPSITLNGMTYTNIAFAFPKGSMHVH